MKLTIHNANDFEVVNIDEYNILFDVKGERFHFEIESEESCFTLVKEDGKGGWTTLGCKHYYGSELSMMLEDLDEEEFESKDDAKLIEVLLTILGGSGLIHAPLKKTR